MRMAVSLSARTVAVSRPLADHLSRDLRIDRSRIAMIPNGVQPASPAGTTVRKELGLQPWDRLAVCVGNLYPVKGHCHAIDALATLVFQWPTLHLAIAGRGELADALADRARQHGLGGRVHFLGLRSDVPAILRAADVFLMPSLNEGLPLALLEAMFAGTPIVASNVGEVGHALGDGDAGVLVPPGDATALAGAVDALLSDPDRARWLGECAAARAAAEYDVAQMVGRYAHLYTEAARHRRVASGPRPVAPALS
jgi:glycosyltransferase involved in cell wall biosynthesis